ncbi:unnamed protein product, partial [Cylindrotheca closterium]
RKAKRAKADADAIMIGSELKASSSRTSNEDTEMANSEHGNEEENESTAYEMLVKDSLLQRWSEVDNETLKKYLTIIGKAKEFPDAQVVNFRQDVICDAVVAAFQGNQDMISEAKSAFKTATALAGTSLNFLKHQQERLKIESESDLDRFLSILCANVLKEYYKRTKEQARSQTVSSETNDRMVPVSARQGNLEMRRITIRGEHENLSGWVGREEAKNQVEGVVRRNFGQRMSTDHGDFAFLVATGHVRSGKTRTGIEVPDIVKNFCDSEKEHRFTDVVYLKIDFLNLARFNRQFDSPNLPPSESLGARMMISYFDTMILQRISHEEAMKKILDDVLSTFPEGQKRIVPVVIHIDEHAKHFQVTMAGVTFWICCN